MQDELRLCANCHHEHKWGILGYSQDGVPLYGARRCEHWEKPVYGDKGHEYWKIGDLVEVCHCEYFATAADGDVNLPTLTNEQTQALWSKTSFLNAQVPAATRILMSNILQLLETGAQNLDPAIAGAIREFMGLVVSQITDVRGALVRDDSKFALLVSHTDEIVEAMKGVVQLKERLDGIYAVQERVLEAIDSLRKQKGEQESVSIQEAAHVFAAKSAPLWNEPIITNATTDDNSD